MDGLSAAASVIAVIQMTETVASLCFQYLKAVKNAKCDIQRLQSELTSLKAVLEGAKKLLEGPNGAKLGTSQRLRSTLDRCLSQLKDLATKLEDKQKTGKRRHRMKWPFESKDVDSIIQNLHNFRDVFSTSLQVDQTSLLLENFQRVGDEERLQVLNWISSIPYRKHHNTVKEARTSDTCEWLLKDKRFCEWEGATSSVVLWLQGSPGAGKTFLTSKVIDHVQNQPEGSLSHEGLAFFYCNRNEEARRSPLSVLQSYVRQLSTTVGNTEEIRNKLLDLRRETMLKGSDLGVEACREQLLESVNLYQRTTLILDALDECEPSSRDRLVETIEFLLSNSKNPLRVFISSRPDGDIRDQFKSRPSIEVQATDNHGDIEKFVNTEITKHRRWGKISPLLREHIVQTILDRSNGMFQWAYLQIRQLLELLTEAAIRDRLGKLPIGLKATYDEIYGKIAARNKYEKAVADRAFMLVMCAVTSLGSVELLSAIRFDLNSDNLELSEEVDEDLLLDLCNNLLVLDTQRKVWRFSHLSVAEYFENNFWNLQQAHCHAAKICLKILIGKCPGSRTSSFDSSVDEQDDDATTLDFFPPRHPLQVYSRYYWVNHIHAQGEQDSDPALAGLLKDFLGSPQQSSLQYRRWYSQVPDDSPPLSSFLFSYNVLRQISPASASVFAICRFSLHALLSDWWSDAEFPISQTNGEGSSLLSIASLAGCRPICETLIKRGLDVNLQDREYGSALAAAAASGNIEIVQFLIKQGADVNMQLQTGKYGSALAAAAAAFKNLKIVQFLIKQGADVNMRLQSGWYGSALAAAAASRNIEIVQFLIKQGADVNMQLQTGLFGSALAAAAAFGNLEIVQFLIKQGADVNMQLQTVEYGSALAAAAVSKNLEIVQFLIEQDAVVNMQLQTGLFGSALAAAAAFGNLEIVQFLIKQGADVNMQLQTGEYGSALAAAAVSKNLEIVQFLIEQDAVVNMQLQTGQYGSALAAATAESKNLEIVQFLIKQGADVNMQLQTGEYGSALAAATAALFGKIETVQFLIKQGADVNTQLQTGNYGSALVAAAAFGKIETVQFLIKQGADVNMQLQTGKYGSALAAAIGFGDTKMVEFLIKQGKYKYAASDLVAI